jgi:hypothetical protein
LTEPLTATLIGAVKLVPEADGIGVAVFIAGNVMRVPKMDGEFRIVDFLEFYNEQGFQIIYDLPQRYKGREVRLGDPSPLPFWNKGICNIVEGDAERALLEHMFGVEPHTDLVLRDLGRMLDDARSGRINAQIAEWEAADLASGFDDVFLGPPSRTRYWVSRYRVALQNARKLANPPHPIDVRLRNAANLWLQKFATRSEPAMLGSILGTSAQGIFSSEQIRNILFAYIEHKLAVKNKADLETIFREDTASVIFPRGIYYYFVKNGWPHVPFKYTRADLVDLMKQAVTHGSERSNYDNAVKLSKLLFGNEDAPNAVDDHAMVFISRAVSAFRSIKERGEEDLEQFPLTSNKSDWSREALQQYMLIEQLSRICHGSDRVAGNMMEGRFGIDPDEIERLRMRAASPINGLWYF